MKDFLTTWLMTMIGCTIATVFLLGWLTSSIWSLLITVSFLLAVLITIFMRQETRIEKLEQEIRSLKSESEPELE